MEKEKIKFNKDGMPIRISRLVMHRDGAYRGPHSHSAIEIITVKSGTLNCYINGNRIPVTANQTVLINSNIGHALTSDDAEIVYVQIDISSYKGDTYGGAFAALYEFISSAQAAPYLLLSDNRELGEILQKIEGRYYEDREESRWYLKAHIYELTAFLFSCAFVQPLPEIKTEKIAPLVRYIDENFKQPITLDDICAAVGYNKYALCHSFKAVTGQTVFAYVNFLRIQAAVKMFAEKNRTITEIATQCGFSSAAYFNRVFKNLMGCAPSAYRKYF